MKVFLSPLAELKLELLIVYINTEWGESSKEKFLIKLKTTVDRISKFPESNPKSNGSTIPAIRWDSQFTL